MHHTPVHHITHVEHNVFGNSTGKGLPKRELHLGPILWWSWQDGLIVVVLLLLLVEDLKLEKELLLLQYFGIG